MDGVTGCTLGGATVRIGVSRGGGADGLLSAFDATAEGEFDEEPAPSEVLQESNGDEPEQDDSVDAPSEVVGGLSEQLEGEEKGDSGPDVIIALF